MARSGERTALTQLGLCPERNLAVAADSQLAWERAQHSFPLQESTQHGGRRPSGCHLPVLRQAAQLQPSRDQLLMASSSSGSAAGGSAAAVSRIPSPCSPLHTAQADQGGPITPAPASGAAALLAASTPPPALPAAADGLPARQLAFTPAAAQASTGSSGSPSPRAPSSPALAEAAAGVREAEAVLRAAHEQRRQLWGLADRLMAVERGRARSAEEQLWEARQQVGRWQGLCRQATRGSRARCRALAPVLAKPALHPMCALCPRCAHAPVKRRLLQPSCRQRWQTQQRSSSLQRQRRQRPMRSWRVSSWLPPSRGSRQSGSAPACWRLGFREPRQSCRLSGSSASLCRRS